MEIKLIIISLFLIFFILASVPASGDDIDYTKLDASQISVLSPAEVKGNIGKLLDNPNFNSIPGNSFDAGLLSDPKVASKLSTAQVQSIPLDKTKIEALIFKGDKSAIHKLTPAQFALISGDKFDSTMLSDPSIASKLSDKQIKDIPADKDKIAAFVFKGDAKALAKLSAAQLATIIDDPRLLPYMKKDITENQLTELVKSLSQKNQLTKLGDLGDYDGERLIPALEGVFKDVKFRKKDNGRTYGFFFGGCSFSTGTKMSCIASDGAKTTLDLKNMQGVTLDRNKKGALYLNGKNSEGESFKLRIYNAKTIDRDKESGNLIVDGMEHVIKGAVLVNVRDDGKWVVKGGYKGSVDGIGIDTRGSYAKDSGEVYQKKSADGKYLDTDDDGWWDAMDSDGDGSPDQGCKAKGCGTQALPNNKMKYFDSDNDGWWDSVDSDGDGVPDKGCSDKGCDSQTKKNERTGGKSAVIDIGASSGPANTFNDGQDDQLDGPDDDFFDEPPADDVDDVEDKKPDGTDIDGSVGAGSAGDMTKPDTSADDLMIPDAPSMKPEKPSPFVGEQGSDIAISNPSGGQEVKVGEDGGPSVAFGGEGTFDGNVGNDYVSGTLTMNEDAMAILDPSGDLNVGFDTNFLSEKFPVINVRPPIPGKFIPTEDDARFVYDYSTATLGFSGGIFQPSTYDVSLINTGDEMFNVKFTDGRPYNIDMPGNAEIQGVNFGLMNIDTKKSYWVRIGQSTGSASCTDCGRLDPDVLGDSGSGKAELNGKNIVLTARYEVEIDNGLGSITGAVVADEDKSRIGNASFVPIYTGYDQDNKAGFDIDEKHMITFSLVNGVRENLVLLSFVSGHHEIVEMSLEGFRDPSSPLYSKVLSESDSPIIGKGTYRRLLSISAKERSPDLLKSYKTSYDPLVISKIRSMLEQDSLRQVAFTPYSSEQASYKSQLLLERTVYGS